MLFFDDVAFISLQFPFLLLVLKHVVLRKIRFYHNLGVFIQNSMYSVLLDYYICFCLVCFALKVTYSCMVHHLIPSTNNPSPLSPSSFPCASACCVMLLVKPIIHHFPLPSPPSHFLGVCSPLSPSSFPCASACYVLLLR